MTGTAVDWLRRGCDVGRLNGISKFYIYILLRVMAERIPHGHVLDTQRENEIVFR